MKAGSPTGNSQKCKIALMIFTWSQFTTTNTTNSLQHQANRDSHRYGRSSSIQIYSNPPSLHSPKKFPFPLNLSLQHPPAQFRNDPVFVWPTRTRFGNLLSFIRGTCPGHLIISHIIAVGIRIERHFLHSLLLEIQTSVSSIFRRAYASEPYLTTIITLALNILIFVQRFIFILFQTFLTVKKYPGPLLFYF